MYAFWVLLDIAFGLEMFVKSTTCLQSPNMASFIVLQTKAMCMYTYMFGLSRLGFCSFSFLASVLYTCFFMYMYNMYMYVHMYISQNVQYTS